VQFVLDVVQDVLCTLEFLLFLVYAFVHTFRALQADIEVFQHDLITYVTLGGGFQAYEGVVAEVLDEDQQ
jgi:hypothetical protein